MYLSLCLSSFALDQMKTLKTAVDTHSHSKNMASPELPPVTMTVLPSCKKHDQMLLFGLQGDEAKFIDIKRFGLMPR